MCYGPLKILSETWKSPENLFLKKGTNPMSVLGIAVIGGASCTFFFLAWHKQQATCTCLYNLAAYPRCMLILLIVDFDFEIILWFIDCRIIKKSLNEHLHQKQIYLLASTRIPEE